MKNKPSEQDYSYGLFVPIITSNQLCLCFWKSKSNLFSIPPRKKNINLILSKIQRSKKYVKQEPNRIGILHEMLFFITKIKMMKMWCWLIFQIFSCSVDKTSTLRLFIHSMYAHNILSVMVSSRQRDDAGEENLTTLEECHHIDPAKHCALLWTGKRFWWLFLCCGLAAIPNAALRALWLFTLRLTCYNTACLLSIYV